MMPSSMEDADALGGMTVLVAGDDLGTVQAVRARLSALGADATALAGDVEAIARAAAAPAGGRDGGDRRLRGGRRGACRPAPAGARRARAAASSPGRARRRAG